MKHSTLTLLFILAIIIAAKCQDDNEDHKSQVAQELVGKWCYIPNNAESIEGLTNSCVTLNGDGTYDIQADPSTLRTGGFATMQTSDAGTWWVDQGKIFYNSTTRGKGSFRFQKANHPRLEKTPVIILDGIVFCTATPRDPW